ncbi:MAG: hypothetical protein RSB67_01455 [Clostridia bacterium]
MKKASGLTMVSIVLYVVLFFLFTTFAVAMSANMNYKIMTEKGNIYINEQRDKLQVNLLSSAKSSQWVETTADKITFSNNDIYTYDSTKKTIFKNGGVLVKSVEECKFDILPSNLTSINAETLAKIDSASKSFATKIKFLKYKEEKSCEFFFALGDELNE